MQAKVWIAAFRPRTLPLALSCIAMGGFLAASMDSFRWDVFLLCALTTVLLQILSNLANDYGDSINGADHDGRIGPSRAVQTGSISKESMRRALIIFILLCLVSGVSLLWVSLGSNLSAILFFFGLGLLSILAAIAYTVGKKPYGYAGLGDFSVLVFFGIVGVLGSLYLFTQSIRWDHLLPAMSCGFFSMGVLNINNIRDIESDKKAGKYSIPVRIGREKAIRYHQVLIAAGLFCAVGFSFINYTSIIQLLYLVTVPLFIVNVRSVCKKASVDLDPYLKQLAISTLLFVVLFGIGNLVG